MSGFTELKSKDTKGRLNEQKVSRFLADAETQSLKMSQKKSNGITGEHNGGALVSTTDAGLFMHKGAIR